MTYAPALDAHDIGVDEPSPDEWLDELEESVKLATLGRIMLGMSGGGVAPTYRLQLLDIIARDDLRAEQARTAVLDALRRADGDE